VEEMSDEVYSRVVHYDEVKDIQVRVGVNVFREVEYLFLRKYYRNFEGEWAPSNEGVNMPLDLNNSRELFAGLLEILSLAESKQIIVDHFKELIETTYQ
jgi:hypothetical protein